MPQLRDSGTRSLHAAEPVPSAEMDGFCRIFGVETEYGVAVTGASRPVDAGQVAMTMFQPIVSRSRSTNTYLSNGSRLYLDVGSHPEYATAEARDPREALVQDLAGERVMRNLALKAQAKLRESYGEHATIHVFKNNVDSAGHAFGCHENYLVRRFVPLEAIEHQLLPFLITRQLYTGAGRMTPDGFQITQRADFLDEAVSSATTRSRPMVNTRDEPHADPDSFRRLHVIIGDSNRSQWATWMKLAVTHLVLCVIEEAARRGVPSGFEACALADAGAANRAVSHDVTCREARLALADPAAYREVGESLPHERPDTDSGSIVDSIPGAADSNRYGDSDGNGDAVDRAGMPTALDIQYRYLTIVERFVERHMEALKDDVQDGAAADGIGPLVADAGPSHVIAEWRSALDALRDGRIDNLADRVDWIAKKRVLDALKRRRPDATFAQLEQFELDYHDIANGRLYDSLVSRGQLRELVTASDVERAIHEPPADTRAALRGRFVTAALAAGAQFSADWTHLTVTAPQRHEAVLLNPFDADETPEFTRLMEALGR